LSSDSSLEENDEERLLPAPSVVDEDVNLKFEAQSCQKTGTTEVTCDVLITNLDAQSRQEIKLSVNADSVPNTDAIDSSGTVYPAQRAESGSGFSDVEEPNGSVCGCFAVNLASDIPTKITFVFEIPQEVTELAALDVGYLLSASGATRKTAIPKVGAIASR
jgi:hypothetical protein